MHKNKEFAEALLHRQNLANGSIWASDIFGKTTKCSTYIVTDQREAMINSSISNSICTHRYMIFHCYAEGQIWLGAGRDAANLDRLVHHGITHILNCADGNNYASTTTMQCFLSFCVKHQLPATCECIRMMSVSNFCQRRLIMRVYVYMFVW